MLSSQEQNIISSIKEWEHKNRDYYPTDFENMYNAWMETGFGRIAPSVRQRFFNSLDAILFHLHAMIQGSQLQMDARNRILSSARIFDENIKDIHDMKELSIEQLSYIAEQQIAKHRVYSFAQGGVSGTGGILTLGLDVPALTALNLRAVQLIAMTYGYDVNYPREMMISLKVFHASTLPKHLQYEGWQQLKGEIENDGGTFWYEGEEDLTDETWMNEPLKQIAKILFLSMFRKKLIQGIPLLGMAAGAAMNYQLSRQVTEYAHRFYQLRHLHDTKGDIAEQ
ncbi:EcsC family protein [Bacillus marinisedimentorum]|uniref:EcsC family protein n=1 Tax=Bacillus marinisedimentorum TaxID=1821260 RepID=UPI0007DEB3AE|nr:EcsC family protein [Bacillus marinisedimentorum]